MSELDIILSSTPKTWKISKVTRHYHLGRGRVISKEEIQENSGLYPVYSSQTKNNGELGFLNSYDFEGDYITWTTDGANAGTVTRRTGKFNCTNVCGTLLKKDTDYQLDNRYVAFYLDSIAKYFVRMDINPKLMNDTMAEIPLVVPPLKMQVAIANKLETVNKVYVKAKEALEKKKLVLKDYYSSVITQTVTKGINLNVAMKDSGIEWLGEIPTHWNAKPLKYITRSYSGGTPSKENSDFWTNGNIPWVSAKDMKQFYIDAAQDYITEEAVSESSTKLVPCNSMLIVVRSGILKKTVPVAINRIPVTINQDIKVYEVNIKGMNTEFLANYLIGRENDILFNTNSLGATVDSLDSELLGKFPIVIPPFEEQQQINKFIEKKRCKYNKIISAINQQILNLDNFYTSLITAAVTGQMSEYDIDNTQFLFTETEYKDFNDKAAVVTKLN